MLFLTGVTIENLHQSHTFLYEYYDSLVFIYSLVYLNNVHYCQVMVDTHIVKDVTNNIKCE
jgi:hypothetical protein